MVHGYLLDTMIVSFWFDKERGSEHEHVTRLIDALPPGTPLTVSAVTLGEIEYGHRCLSSGDTPVQVDLNRFVQDNIPMVLDVKASTRLYYGPLRAALFSKFAPRERRRKSRWPEECIDPTSAKELGIQENDLWIAAQALEHNLVLVTHDKMQRLRDVCPELGIEDWAAPDG